MPSDIRRSAQPCLSAKSFQPSAIASSHCVAWPQTLRPSRPPFAPDQPCARPSPFRFKPEEKGVPHGSIIESPKRETQTGTENLNHILVVDDDTDGVHGHRDLSPAQQFSGDDR